MDVSEDVESWLGLILSGNRIKLGLTRVQARLLKEGRWEQSRLQEFGLILTFGKSRKNQ